MDQYARPALLHLGLPLRSSQYQNTLLHQPQRRDRGTIELLRRYSWNHQQDSMQLLICLMYQAFVQIYRIAQFLNTFRWLPKRHLLTEQKILRMDNQKKPNHKLSLVYTTHYLPEQYQRRLSQYQ